jgi:hypothetical protein
MHHCLSKSELYDIIDYKLLNKDKIDDANKILLEKAENWEISLDCLIYFFSMLIERKLNNSVNISNIINEFYLLDKSAFIVFQEFDTNFIENLIRNIREESLDLEDELIQLQINMDEHNYEKTLRF